MKYKVLVYSLVLVLIASKSIGQIDPSSKSVIDKFIQAIGGKESVRKISTSYFEYQSIGSEGDTSKFSGSKINGKKYRLDIKSKNIQHTIVYTNGKAKQNKNGNISDITDIKQLEFLELQSYILPELAYGELDYTVKYDGTWEKEGIKYHHLIVISPKGKTSSLLYEDNSGFLDISIDSDGTESHYKDYQFHDGLWFPNKIVSIASDGSTEEYFFKTALINTELDPKLFKL